MTKFYSRFNYPHPSSYLSDGGKGGVRPELVRGIQVMVPSVMVAGCGTIEALMVARENPGSRVIGVDSSATSIEICRDLMRRNETPIDNLELVVSDLFEFRGSQVSAIVLSGVLHHVSEPLRLLSHLRLHLQDNGCITGFVYWTVGREHILETREVFKDYPKDSWGCQMVRDYLSSLPHTHPSRAWFEQYEKTDSEIADTWLNPYAVHYEEDELKDLLSSAGFKPKVQANPAASHLYFLGET